LKRAHTISTYFATPLYTQLRRLLLAFLNSLCVNLSVTLTSHIHLIILFQPAELINTKTTPHPKKIFKYLFDIVLKLFPSRNVFARRSVRQLAHSKLLYSGLPQCGM